MEEPTAKTQMEAYKKLFAAVLMILAFFSGNAFAEDTYPAVKIISSGFGNINNTEVVVHIVRDGYLYAGTRNDSEGSSIWRSVDGTTWDLIPQTDHGFGDPNNTQIMSMYMWREHFYASTRNEVTGTELWRSPDGLSWSQVNSNGFGSSGTTKARAILSYQGNLFVTTGNYTTGGRVWRSSDGTTWSQINDNGFGNAFNTDVAAAAVFDGYLYCATENEMGPAQGIEIWRYDGALWVRTTTGGFGDANNVFPTNMTVFENYLYVGAENNSTLGTMWRSPDGTTWEKVAQVKDSALAPALIPTVSLDSRLYAGGSFNRNGLPDAVYSSLDGKTWVKAAGISGIPSLSYDGSLFIVSQSAGGNFNDVYKTARYKSGQTCMMDLSNDGKIGMAEAIYILQTVAGLR